MNDMRLIYGPSVIELALDKACERNERLAVWRRKRQSELECGMDADAFADSMEADPAEWHQELAALCATQTPDRKLLKLDEIKARLVQLTLYRETADWRDE